MRRDLLLLAALVLLIRLPFLSQPIQGDDVYYLAMARNGLVDPLHPMQMSYVYQGQQIWMAGHSHPPLEQLHPLPAAQRYSAALRSGLSWRLSSCFPCLPWRGVFSGRRFTADHWRRPCYFWPCRLSCSAATSSKPTCRFWLFGSPGLRLFVYERPLWAVVPLAFSGLAAYQSVFAAPILACWVWHYKPGGRWGRRQWPYALAILSPALLLAAWQAFEMASGAQCPRRNSPDITRRGISAASIAASATRLALTVHLGWILFPLLAVFVFRFRRWIWTLLIFPASTGRSRRLCNAGYTARRKDFWWRRRLERGAVRFGRGAARGSTRDRDDSQAGCGRISGGLGAVCFSPRRCSLSMPEPRATCCRWPRRWRCSLRAHAASRCSPRASPCSWHSASAGHSLLSVCIAISRLRRPPRAAGRLAPAVVQRRLGPALLPGSHRRRSGARRPPAVAAGGAGDEPPGRTAPVQTMGQRSGIAARRDSYGSDSADGGRTSIRIPATPRPGSGCCLSTTATALLDEVVAEVVGASEPTDSYLTMAAPEADNQLLLGFYQLEQNQWRWIGPRAMAVLLAPDAGGAKPGGSDAARDSRAIAVPFELAFHIPEAAPARRVTVQLDGRPLASETYLGPGGYTLRAAAMVVPGRPATVEISVDRAFRVAGDSRELGIIVSGLGFVQKP